MKLTFTVMHARYHIKQQQTNWVLKFRSL